MAFGRGNWRPLPAAGSHPGRSSPTRHPPTAHARRPSLTLPASRPPFAARRALPAVCCCPDIRRQASFGGRLVGVCVSSATGHPSPEKSWSPARRRHSVFVRSAPSSLARSAFVRRTMRTVVRRPPVTRRPSTRPAVRPGPGPLTRGPLTHGLPTRGPPTCDPRPSAPGPRSLAASGCLSLAAGLRSPTLGPRPPDSRPPDSRPLARGPWLPPAACPWPLVSGPRPSARGPPTRGPRSPAPGCLSLAVGPRLLVRSPRLSDRANGPRSVAAATGRRAGRRPSPETGCTPARSSLVVAPPAGGGGRRGVSRRGDGLVFVAWGRCFT
ncbi:hypothetical protein FHU36_002583 [Nonomuraea muscovyensis]|uniref:Uncharacterized protein n=1 Tax=Nonomuraea muscovyensis TaxID=1124761 RepID=A0A7X0C010_9ACTN|nr:hypothetical protein [Nonomuraea muscovyensis]